MEAGDSRVETSRNHLVKSEGLADEESSTDQVTRMLSRLFRAHGYLCASRPWEVIFGTITITVCLMSMSFFAFADKVCGWNYKCVTENDTKSSDILVLTIIRCLAVIYIYLQFRNLRQLGSKYLLGVAGLFTIFSSFVFSIAVINLVGRDLTGLNEALPFFLLIVDLSKACSLAKFALSSKTQDEVRDNISRGMAVLGPTLTLDTLVETLVIGVGTLSGVRRLETMCCFGCLSIIANYLAFMTFYPACLALVLELTRERKTGNPVWRLQYQVSKIIQDEEEQKPNPVTQRVKIIMSAGLVVVHLHSRLAAAWNRSHALEALHSDKSGNFIAPEIPLWKFYMLQSFPPSLDYIVTFGLAALLAFKYVFLDNSLDRKTTAAKKNEKPASQSCNGMAATVSNSENLADAIPSEKLAAEAEAPAAQPDSRPPQRRASFIIGGDSDDSDSEAGFGGGGRRASVAVATQTERRGSTVLDDDTVSEPPRSLQECVAIMKSDAGPAVLSDAEILRLVAAREIPAYKLETALDDHERGVRVRRKLVTGGLPTEDALHQLPYTHYDYTYVEGACCENVIGYMPVPVGVAGPLLMDGTKYQVPMATTEGCLVASTNRGCRALMSSGGVRSALLGDGMTRAPLVTFPSAQAAAECKRWLEEPHNFQLVADIFDSTSRFARLKRLHVKQVAHYLYVRFVAVTGDAMGMNMLSKGCEKSLNHLSEHFFPDMRIVSLSGNYCTDKKPSAVNWIEGRGKSVVCEAVVPGHVVTSVLKTSVAALVQLNVSKNLMGSAAAASVGGFNAHAANIVAAIFIATGQDPAQTVGSASCMTVMEEHGDHGDDLYISCTMPCIEVGTVGGGTVLPPQAACLKMLGVKGSSVEDPGRNAVTLARVVCGAVLAGELSLMSALAAGHLVRSHMRHNRSSINMAASASGFIASQSLPVTPAHAYAKRNSLPGYSAAHAVMQSTSALRSRVKTSQEPGSCVANAS